MNFVSVDFVIFLAIVIVGFYSLHDRWRTHFLLAASYFFYGYWSVPYLMLLIFTMSVDYYFGIKIEGASTEWLRKFYLVCSLTLNLGILFIFKYFNFAMDIIFESTGMRLAESSLILPFAISFYTFHAMSYVIDVYRKIIPAERNFIPYSAYVMFFPQLVAGPIARASHLLHQFEEKKRFNAANWWRASWLIACGYCMKTVLADNLAPAVTFYFDEANAKTPFGIAQGAYFFAFQIYFDFAGYTYIAIGVAKLFGYELVKNFDRPYISTSVTEFWRRWHISLSTWLRDYLYISLGGNRSGKLKTYRNLMLTMLLGGLWHGANLTFVLWGFLHGLYLTLERIFRSSARVMQITNRIPRAIPMFVTFNMVCLAWIPFRSQGISEALDNMRHFMAWLANPMVLSNSHDFQAKLWAMVACWMIFEWLGAKFDFENKYIASQLKTKFLVGYAAISFIMLFSQVNSKAFIYFQF